MTTDGSPEQLELMMLNGPTAFAEEVRQKVDELNKVLAKAPSDVMVEIDEIRVDQLYRHYPLKAIKVTVLQKL